MAIIIAACCIIIVIAVCVKLEIQKHVRSTDEPIFIPDPQKYHINADPITKQQFIDSYPTTGYELISDTETTGSVHFLQNGLYLLGTDAHLYSGKSTLQKLSTNTNAASKWQTDKSRALQCFMEYAKHNNLRIIETTPVYSVHRLNIETGLLVLTEPIDSSNTD